MITSWSPSKLEKYEQCPRKCKLESEDKLCPKCFKGRLKGGYDSPAVCDTCGVSILPAPPLVRGTEIHSKLEAYVKGEGEMDPDIAPVTKWLEAFRKAHKLKQTMVELQVALTSEWKVTSWFAKDAWLRAKIDLLHFRTTKLWDVIDWKTGKFKPDGEYHDQLNIYATAVMSVYPQPQTVEASLVFVDAGKSVTRDEGTLKRADVARAQKRWTNRVRAMLSDKRFAPRPGNYCRWCDYSKSKGGPCPF